MSYGIKILVEGPMALFSRPELKVERVSYPFITPSAARGLIEAIYWHPGMRYVIDRIHVLNPIEFSNVRRNEVKSKISARNVNSVINGGQATLMIATGEDIQQRASMVLKNVRYVIEAHFDLTEKATPTDSAEKFYAILTRRLKKGQCYHQPALGCREFPARFSLYEGEDIPNPHRGKQQDYGLMLLDMDYSDPKNIQPMYFHAVMKDGVIDLTDCEVFR